MTETTLILERQLAAAPERVWRCWTEPELLKQWFAPKPVETLEAVIEPVPGGRFYTVMRVPEHGDMGSEGCILLAEPAARLVFTDCMSQGFQPSEAPFFCADIRMTEREGGTFYHVTAMHATAEAARQHEEMGFSSGWGAATDQLGALAATL